MQNAVQAFWEALENFCFVKLYIKEADSKGLWDTIKLLVPNKPAHRETILFINNFLYKNLILMENRNTEEND